MNTVDWIPADVRARLKGLRLHTRRSSALQGIGQHHSRMRGAGLEFAQYRAYEPGDEPRHIDWKLYARSDKFFVREAERDSPLQLWCVIDCSASMAQEDQARPGFSRLQAAEVLSACCMELALQQGDRFGVVSINSKQVFTSSSGSGRRHRDQCLLHLQSLKALGAWPSAVQSRPLWERVAANSLVLLFSDFFDEASIELAERLSAARRDVRCVQILTCEERDFPFTGGHRFRDVETDAELLTDASTSRASFIEQFDVARKKLSARFSASGIAHTDFFLDQPLDTPLRNLLHNRSRLARQQ